MVKDGPKSRRGRKPKNPVKKISKEENKNSEEETVVTHLNINMEEVTKEIENTNEVSDNDSSIFIKNENIEKNNKPKDKKIKFEIHENNIEEIKEKISELQQKLIHLNKNKKPKTIKSKFKKGTKCFWCRNSFNNPAVQLPYQFSSEIFKCKDNFCSWNCAVSFNLEINDEFVMKRYSLINLMYYMTYGIFTVIKPANHWRTLEEYGGYQSIKEFRKNLLFNDDDYLLLHPPMESLYSSFEKIHVKPRLSEESDELVLKRTTPLKNNATNLEKTFKFKKKRKSNQNITSNM